MAEEKAQGVADEAQDWPKEPGLQKARLKRNAQNRASQLQACILSPPRP